MDYSPLKLTNYNVNCGRYQLESALIDELENYSPIYPTDYSKKKSNIYVGLFCFKNYTFSSIALAFPLS